MTGLTPHFAPTKGNADRSPPVGAGRLAEAYAAALASVPLYALLNIEIHPTLAHRACWFCGRLQGQSPPGPAQRADYLDCLAADIALAARMLAGHGRPASVSFRAGAPLAVTPAEVTAVLDVVEAELGLTDLTGLALELLPGGCTADEAAALVGLGVTRFTVFVLPAEAGAGHGADFERLEATIGDLREAGAPDVGVAWCADLPHRAAADVARLAEEVVMLGPDRIVIHRNADRIARDPALAGLEAPVVPTLPRRIGHALRGGGYAETARGVFVKPERALERAAAEEARLSGASLGFGAGSLTAVSGRRFRKRRDMVGYCGLIEAVIPPVDVAFP